MNDQKVSCPHCDSQMEITDTDIICHKCGYVVSIEWINKTFITVNKLFKETHNNSKEFSKLMDVLEIGLQIPAENYTALKHSNGKIEAKINTE